MLSVLILDCDVAVVDDMAHTVLGACSYCGTCVFGAAAGEEPHGVGMDWEMREWRIEEMER